MMNGGVAELACRNRLRSRDMNGNNKEEEKGKMHYYEEEEDEDGDEEEEEETRGSVKKVQNRKASTAILEKENGKKTTIDLSDDDEKEDVVKLDKQVKNKDEKMMMHGGDDKMKYRMAHTTTSEKEKKKKSVSSHGHAKKMQNGDHDKDKRGNTARPLDKSKDSLKEKSRKMPSSHSGKKKMPSGDHHKEKKSMPSNSKHFGKEKRKSLGSDNKEKRTWYDYGEHKGNNNVMQKNEMKKKMWPNDRTGKKLRTNDKDEKAGSGDRWKTKKRTMEGYTKEQKVPSCHKEKRNVSIAFFKLIYNNFEKFLLLPPVVAPKLTDLTNRSVNLKDSEGKFSEVRLSVVDGSLAFHQGWNDFVSDHSIKLGDFLLFEYTARSQFSVRVFGMDSCERVCFSVERQGGMKRKGCPEPDETGNVAKYMNAVSGARCVAINSKEDPNRVVSGVEHGTSIELYDKDANLADGKLKASDIFQTCSKGIRSSKIIVITDEDPLTQENEHTEKLKTNCISSICSTEKITRSEIIPVVEAAPLAEENDDAVKLTTFPLHIKGTTSMMKKSEPEIATPTECTKIDDSDEDLRSKQEGNTVRLECTTSVDKCPNNSKINTNRNVCSKDEAPGGSESLEKKAPVSGRAALDGTGLIKPEKILKTEEKLVGHCTSMGVNSFEQSFQGYAGRAALDGTGLITPLAQECDDAVKLTTFPLHIEDTSTMKKSEPEIATPTKYTEMHDSDEDLRRKQEGNTVQLQCTTSVDKFRNNSKMNTNRNVCSKYVAPGGSQSLEKKAPVSGRAALDGTGLITPEKLLKAEDKLVVNCSSTGANSFEQSLRGYAGGAALDCTGLIRPEKRMKTEDELVGKCGAMGVNPVGQSLRGYAGTHSCVQQAPGKISKSGHIKTEVDHFVKGKGPIVQPKTEMKQFETMGNITCRQQMNNIPASVDHAAARLSEHRFFKQDDRKSSHHETPAALLPVKVEVLEDDHSVLKDNLKFSIPPTTQTWLELPTSLSNAVCRKGRQDRNVVMLKDPMKRLWPVFYHENSVFLGFTRGWKPFVAANNLQTGDVCELLKDLDEDELVYHVRFTRK